MKLMRMIAIEFTSDDATEEELNSIADMKIIDIGSSIGVSGIFPLWRRAAQKTVRISWRNLGRTHDQKVIYVKPQEGVEAHAREKVPDKG